MIGLMWYLMGMATTAAIWGYFALKHHYELDIKAHLGLICVFGFSWICVGWSWASFAEGEPQSGAMGLLNFGLPAVIIAIFTWRKWIQPYSRSVLENDS